MQTLHRFSTNFFKVWKVFLCSRHRDYLGLDFKTANVDQRVCVTNKGHLFWRAFTMQIGIKRHYQVASWEMYDPILLDWKFTTFLAFVCMALLIGQFQRWQEGGGDMQQRVPGLDSNMGPLQRGQSLCTWDARSTNWANVRPENLHLWFW